MMAFFLVMWITAQNKPVREAIAEHFRSPAGIGSTRDSGGASLLPSKEGRGAAGSIIGPHDGGYGPGLGAPKPDPDAEPGRKKPTGTSKLQPIVVVHDAGQRRAGAVLEFAENDAALTDDAKARLRKLVQSIQGKPNRVEIRGHASRKPLPPGGPYQDAWQLSYARCLATMAYLEEQGIDSQRLRLSQAGAHEPQFTGIDPALQARNARVEIFMLGEFVELQPDARPHTPAEEHAPADHDHGHEQATEHKQPVIHAKPASHAHHRRRKRVALP
jgi:chemotaxis protein MotB